MKLSCSGGAWEDKTSLCLWSVIEYSLKQLDSVLRKDSLMWSRCSRGFLTAVLHLAVSAKSAFCSRLEFSMEDTSYYCLRWIQRQLQLHESLSAITLYYGGLYWTKDNTAEYLTALHCSFAFAELVPIERHRRWLVLLFTRAGKVWLKLCSFNTVRPIPAAFAHFNIVFIMT